MKTFLLFLAALVAADDALEKKADAPARVKVVDPTYTPQAGDRAWLDTNQRDEDGDPYDLWGAVSVDEFKNCVRLSYEVRDFNAALESLEKAKKVVWLDAGTEVEVVSIAPVEMVRNGNAAAGVVCASYRVASGPSKGKTLYGPPQDLVRYVERPAAPTASSVRKKKAARKKPPAPAKPAKPVDPNARAASLLRLGQDLEKKGKTDGAVGMYKQIVKQFPKSPQAATAAARLKALAPH